MPQRCKENRSTISPRKLPNAAHRLLRIEGRMSEEKMSMGKRVWKGITWPVTAVGGFIAGAGTNVVTVASPAEKYAVPENLLIEPVLDFERKMFISANEPPITTTTFFGGDAAAAAAALKKRCKLVFEANPWLAGKVSNPSKGAPLAIIYPAASDITDELMDDFVYLNPEGVTMNEAMTYEALMAQTLIKGVTLPYAATLNVPVFRITVVDSGNGRFCMTVTMSHIVGDGYTYYNILNQICSNKPAIPLEVKRKPELMPKIEEASAPGFTIFPTPGFIFNMITTLKFGPKMKASAYFVDNEKIKVFKAKAKEEGAAFVSTNDIVTSSWGAATNARLLAMAINFRGRIEGAENTMAGNYESVLWLDPVTMKSPAKVRQVLSGKPPYKSIETPMPGFRELCRSRNMLITSWASFAEELVIEGCSQGLHVPCYELARLPFDIAIVFVPYPGQLGLMYFSRTYGDAEFKKMAEEGLLPLGETVSTAMFPA